jgi:CDP-diacylglycerol--glycerol-3-phosphate 3-phosphatidyltransferase
MKLNNLVNLPNSITALRMILVIPVVSLFSRGYFLSAFVVLIIAIFTDFLDGLTARLTRRVTTFGGYFDPFSDKCLIQGVTLFIAVRFISVLAIVVSVILDLLLITLAIGNQCLKLGRKIGANTFGKIKMVFQSAAVTLLLFGLLVGLDHRLFGLNYHQMAESFLWIANGFAVASIIAHICTKEVSKRS